MIYNNCMDSNSIFKKSAFTLVEVLITLALLGVVSAMTIPTLTYNYRSKLLETQFKDTYRELREIGLRINSEYGDVGEHSKVIGLSNWAEEIISHVSGGKAYNKNANSDIGDNNIQDAIKELYKNAGNSSGVHLFGSGKSTTSSILCDNGGIWTDLKGRIWTFNSENRIVCVDINGSALPNMYNVDIFAFIPMTSSQVAQWVYDEDGVSGEYIGQMVLCDADALARNNNSNAVACSEGPNKPTGSSSNNTVSCSLDLCPFNWPFENMAPRYVKKENGSSTTTYPKNRLGQTVKSGDDYWKDYIQYK